MRNPSGDIATSSAPRPDLRIGSRPRLLRGFTLIELLAVVAVISILAAIVIPFLRSTYADQLKATAQVVEADLERARNLALTNQSKYRLVFTPGTDWSRLSPAIVRGAPPNTAGPM